MTSFASLSSSSHWQVLESFALTPSIHVTSYRSSVTGVRVVHAVVEGPLVMGYFTLATESHSNDGCPHTLEHLVFMSDAVPLGTALQRPLLCRPLLSRPLSLSVCARV